MHKRPSKLRRLLLKGLSKAAQKQRERRLYPKRTTVKTFVKLALELGGFGCLTAAAWLIILPLGVATAGISCFIMAYHIDKG